MGAVQGLVKGAKLCFNPYFYLAGWRSELAGCRSTHSMSKIKVKTSLDFNYVKPCLDFLKFKLQLLTLGLGVKKFSV